MDPPTVSSSELREYVSKLQISNAQFCKFFGISERVFYYWVKDKENIRIPTWLARQVRGESIAEFAEKQRQLKWPEYKD
jgi:hypothetical protein